MDYKQVVDKLGKRDSKKVMHNTYLQFRSINDTQAGLGGMRPVALKYHKTDVIMWYADGSIVIDVDGWQTRTTKLRLNEFLPDGFGVYSNKGIWYIGRHYNRPVPEEHAYADGLTLRMNGDGHFHVDPDTVGEDPKAMLKIRRKVDKYAKAFVEALRAGKVGPPSAGDCWYCYLRVSETGKPMGERFESKSHIESHIEESYFVPSLVVRAMEVFPCSQVMRWALAEVWKVEGISGFRSDDYAWDGIRKNIKRYVLRQLGMAA